MIERSREPYVWDAVWASKGSFQEEEFVVPEAAFSSEEARAAASRTLPVGRWIVVICGSLAAALTFGSALVRGAVILAVVATVVWLWKVARHRRQTAASALQLLTEEYSRDTEFLRSVHRLNQAALREQWDKEERGRARLRAAEREGDADALAAVLEAEVANEAFPIPVVFELEMNDVHEARIELALPEIHEIPDERTLLTKTGKLSRKPMSQRDRVALYSDLCTGMALRLVFETLRVLPMVSEVEITGTSSGNDPATGHSSTAVALHLHVDRSAFGTIDWDTADPSSALSGLGGRFACDRQGHLGSIPGAVGLLEP
jgi:hypothetical protein